MHSMTGEVEDRSKNTKRKQMALLMLKHRNILHNKRNTMLPHTTEILTKRFLTSLTTS